MTTFVYNRPAVVESVYSDVVEVRFIDEIIFSDVAGYQTSPNCWEKVRELYDVVDVFEVPTE